ncbi:Imm49 family immunity protein [Cystobacter fuscus]|uniref:Imm49 family immunity protein n=1 Tax=Cystobacter fuscus TaxID=43 RepID=UPI002B2CC01F|nr:hypothetical protein F0U63_39925 [Cystobacter fuscus]
MESSLEIDQENIRFILRSLLDSLRSGPQPLELEGVTTQEISIRYRRLAICSLLLDASTASFYRLLSHSSQAYLSVLRKVDWSTIASSYYLCASRALPFFDAIAASDLGTARDIAQASALSWMEEDEYEDDFLYMRFLMELTSDRQSPGLARMLQRFRKVAAGSAPARLKVCEALIARDGAAFGAAMEELELERQEELERLRRNSGTDPQRLSTEAHVFIEGLAVVRLAGMVGIETAHQYPGIPSLVVATSKAVKPDPQAWWTLA